MCRLDSDFLNYRNKFKHCKRVQIVFIFENHFTFHREHTLLSYILFYISIIAFQKWLGFLFYWIIYENY